MKALTTRAYRLLTALLLTTAALTFLVSTSAQAKDVVNAKDALMHKMASNLAVALKTENEGLKKSAIYMAGYYRIEAVVNDLVELLSKEKDAKTRTLISLALYRIGNKEAIDAIRHMTAADSNKEVRRMGNAILAEHASDKKSNILTAEY